MRVQRLTLKNFRNLDHLQLSPEENITFIVGKNGEGKTSVLEALGVLSSLRSFRGNKIEDTLKNNHSFSEIVCVLDDGLKTELKVVLKKENSRTFKNAFINGKLISKGSQYLQKRFGDMEIGFHCIVFNPSDHELIRGEPSHRRDYIDRVISAQSTEYLECLTKYYRSLEQRNRLLKQEIPIDEGVLSGFTQSLVELGSKIIQMRMMWINKTTQNMNLILQEIIPLKPEIQMTYVSKIFEKNTFRNEEKSNDNARHFSGQSEAPSIDFFKECLWQTSRRLGTAERAAKVTLFGPHRDDWEISFHGASLKSVGSQGEVRAVLIALKLSEIENFRVATGHRPVLLLDDFSSELDQERRQYLLNYLQKTDLQVFVTTTEEPRFLNSFFWLSDGVIKKQESQN